MTLGSASNDKFRAATSTMTPSGSTARVRCAICARIQSIGQFSKEHPEVCITCKPQGANFRRGGV